MPKISVIIPYFNIENDLICRCLNSVLAQTFQNFEIIVIDDGSQAPYKDTLYQIESLDSRIKVIHQGNQGVSSARNNGLCAASGKYIVFVDADDVLLPFFFQEAYKLCEKNEIDFLIGANTPLKNREWAEKIDNESFIVEKIDSANVSTLKMHLVGNVYRYDEKAYIGRGPWTRFINAEIAKNVKFDEKLKMGEDIDWNIRMLNKCKNIYVAHRVWYLYYENPNSVTHKYNPEIIAEVVQGLKKLEKELELNDPEQNVGYRQHLLAELRKIFICYIGHSKCELRLREKRKIIHDLYITEPWVQIKKKKNVKNADFKTAVKIFSFDIHCFFLVLKIRKFLKRL